MKNLFIIAVSMFLISCSPRAIERTVSNKETSKNYFSKAELIEIMEKCKSVDDVYALVGDPSYTWIDEYQNGDSLWVYSAPVEQNIVDGISGFSMRISTNGQIMWWEPILSNRKKGIKSVN